MSNLVDVTIPVEGEVAAALADARKRDAVGRVITRLLYPSPSEDPLLDAMQLMSAEARARGLTSDVVAAEAEAHKRQRVR